MALALQSVIIRAFLRLYQPMKYPQTNLSAFCGGRECRSIISDLDGEPIEARIA